MSLNSQNTQSTSNGIRHGAGNSVSVADQTHNPSRDKQQPQTNSKEEQIEKKRYRKLRSGS
eukprot:UN04415